MSKGVLPTVFLPVRLNFCGGWSDQLVWIHEPNCVVNAALGWTSKKGGPYPITINPDGSVQSLIRGRGTGLGVSSILLAGKYLQQKEGDGLDRTYILHVLAEEAKMGVYGGWQDQIGGIEPGFKRITARYHRQFAIEDMGRQPIIDHLVLFDSGIRREARVVGEKVRYMIISRHMPFIKVLRENVRDAKQIRSSHSVDDFADRAIAGWDRLCSLIPEMRCPIPVVDDPGLVWGHMLVGAGGGGFGVLFVKEPEMRDEVVQKMKQLKMWATKPLLLDGVKYQF